MDSNVTNQSVMVLMNHAKTNPDSCLVASVVNGEVLTDMRGVLPEIIMLHKILEIEITKQLLNTKKENHNK